MNIDTGEIRPMAEVPPGEAGRWIEMLEPPTERQNEEGRVRATDRCPCGSQKMYKNCHRKIARASRGFPPLAQ